MTRRRVADVEVRALLSTVITILLYSIVYLLSGVKTLSPIYGAVGSVHDVLIAPGSTTVDHRDLPLSFCSVGFETCRAQVNDGVEGWVKCFIRLVQLRSHKALSLRQECPPPFPNGKPCSRSFSSQQMGR